MIVNALFLSFVMAGSSMVRDSAALRDLNALAEALGPPVTSSGLVPTRTAHDFGVIDQGVGLETEFSLRVVGELPIQIETLRPS